MADRCAGCGTPLYDLVWRWDAWGGGHHRVYRPGKEGLCMTCARKRDREWHSKKNRAKRKSVRSRTR